MVIQRRWILKRTRLQQLSTSNLIYGFTTSGYGSQWWGLMSPCSISWWSGEGNQSLYDTVGIWFTANMAQLNVSNGRWPVKERFWQNGYRLCKMYGFNIPYPNPCYRKSLVLLWSKQVQKLPYSKLQNAKLWKSRSLKWKFKVRKLVQKFAYNVKLHKSRRLKRETHRCKNECETVVLSQSPKFHRCCSCWRPLNQHRHSGGGQCSPQNFSARIPANSTINIEKTASGNVHPAIGTMTSLSYVNNAASGLLVFFSILGLITGKTRYLR